MITDILITYIFFSLVFISSSLLKFAVEADGEVRVASDVLRPKVGLHSRHVSNIIRPLGRHRSTAGGRGALAHSAVFLDILVRGVDPVAKECAWKSTWSMWDQTLMLSPLTDTGDRKVFVKSELSYHF